MSMLANGLRHGTFVALVVAAAALPGCSGEPGASEGVAQAATLPAERPAGDDELERCRKRSAELAAKSSLPGAPELDSRRAEVFGRARGEPTLWLREPKATPDQELSAAALQTRRASQKKGSPGRIKLILERHKGDRATLRALLLRQGYVYSSDPHEALALVSELDLVSLFDEPTLVLQRGNTVYELTRNNGRWASYRHADGRNAELLLGDRVGVTRAELARPLHRDLRSLARDVGFDRTRVLHRADEGVIAELRFGQTWVKALLASEGPKLSVACFDAPAEERARVRSFIDANAERRRALGFLHEAVSAHVAEAIPFDRPRDEKTAERDGQLRPLWRWAYKNGHDWFSHEEVSYPVFDAKGRPTPPQMCVDFVLDSFERAAGTWYRPRGGERARGLGSFDFNAEGIQNRAGVLAFEKFAEEHPKLFAHRRFSPEERIPFGDRTRFFGYLLEHADDFRPGDIVAIQGLKGDGLIHQHAILIEDTDPMTGFPEALADQMKRPRRRTWEGIMAEAPLRSLLFHLRPSDEVWRSIGRAAQPE